LKKDLVIIFGLFLLIFVLVVFGKGYTTGSFLQLQSSGTASAKKGVAVVTVNDLKIDAKILTRASDRKKGLSGRESLPISEGLLFVFENNGQYPFWMKDMEFAIDIIWIDENKRIAYIVHNAPPEPGRDDDELTLYKPGVFAKYVLEINAGLAQRYGIVVGDLVNFEL